MSSDDLILKRLLEEASVKWGKDIPFILETIGKIASVESNGDPNAVGLTNVNDPSGTRDLGLFQFTEGKDGTLDNRAGVARNRTEEIMELFEMNTPSWIEDFHLSNYDATTLSPTQQTILYLGDLLNKPNNPGYVKASMDWIRQGNKAETNEDVKKLWIEHHKGINPNDPNSYGAYQDADFAFDNQLHNKTFEGYVSPILNDLEGMISSFNGTTNLDIYTGTYDLTLDEFPIVEYQEVDEHGKAWDMEANILTEYATLYDTAEHETGNLYILYPTMYGGSVLEDPYGDAVNEGLHFGVYNSIEELEQADEDIHNWFNYLNNTTY